MTATSTSTSTNGRRRFWAAIATAPMVVASLLAGAALTPQPAHAGPLYPIVSAGAEFTCAVTTQSQVYCWGRNDAGELGQGTTTPLNNTVPLPVHGLPPAVAVATGSYSACAIDTTANLWCWGDNIDGELGIGNKTTEATPVIVHGGLKFSAVAVGGFFTCGITTSGAVYCWGNNSDGELGNGTTTLSKAPVLVSALRGEAVQIATGGQHTCVVLNTGSVDCWGQNNDGQLGNGTTTDSDVPAAVSGLGGVTAVTAGEFHSCAILAGGALRCWGENADGQVGDGTTTTRITPVPVSGLSGGVTQVSAGATHTCALVTTPATMIECWGDGRWGELGDGVGTGHPNRDVPTPVFGIIGTASGAPGGPVQVAAGAEHTCAVISTGQVECWGFNTNGEVGDGTLSNRVTPVYVIGLTSGPQAISEGGTNGCALTQSLGAACWGSADGDDFSAHTSAQAVLGLSTAVAQLAAGNDSTCALSTAGALQCWGENYFGEVGDGTKNPQATPVNITQWPNGSVPIGFTTVGGEESCAASTNGQAFCWGYGGSGALGDGNTSNSDVPKSVHNVGHVAQISAAAFETACAVQPSGDAYCWGSNQYGEVGNGTTSDSHVAVAVIGLPSAAVQIAVGGPYNSTTPDDFTCAVLVTGDVYCWGWNGSGQIGNGLPVDTNPHPVPSEVALPGPARMVVAGYFNTCALLDDGAVWCWGDNSYGELGSGGSPSFTSTPVPVTGLSSGVIAISNDGSASTCALLASPAQVECWGDNEFDELGDGTSLGFATTPQVVQGL